MALILDMDRADAYDIDGLLREGGVINVLIMGGNFMAAERKMSVCKHCGAEIAANAKVCPKCGGKNKRPLYKRPWFLVLAALLALAIVGNLGGQSQNPAPEEDAGTTAQENLAPADTERGEEPVYTACSVSEMMELLGNNALKASEQYEGQYMEVTGRLAVIDSDGSSHLAFAVSHVHIADVYLLDRHSAFDQLKYVLRRLADNCNMLIR